MSSGMKKALAVLPLIAALAACGGGGGGGDAADAAGAVDASAGAAAPGAPASGGSAGNADSDAPAPTSSVVAYEKGASPRYQFVGVGLQSSGRLDVVEQLADGGVVTINASTLTGATRAVADVAGDASFAIGRWSKGTATTGGGASLLDSLVSGAYHYIVYNAPATFPAGGTYQCDDGQFTSPSQNNGLSSVYFAKSTGKAALSFGDGGAVVDVSITTTAGSQQGTVSVAARTIATPATMAITGNYFAGGEGMSLSIADAGSNKLRIVTAYQSKAGDGTYRGVGAFTCTAK